MHVSVEFEDQRLDLDLPEDRVVGSWQGPRGLAGADAAEAERRALDEPLDFPPVGQMVVPGDHVVIAWDSSLDHAGGLLGGLIDRLRDSGVLAEDIVVVATPGPADEQARAAVASRGGAWEVHDPADQEQLAYLATTKDGRRIYLNRRLTDADAVIPVGRVGHDPILGYRGPWSLLFPALADAEALRSYRHHLAEDPADEPAPRVRWDESIEVDWLLGSQYQVGVVPGGDGPAAIVAGLGESVRARAVAELERLWSFRPEYGAECVVVGVGSPGRAAGIDELVEGLVTASRLVNHGGKILALSRAGGEPGPSLRRLTAVDDMRKASGALRGHDDDADSVSGRRLARVLSWADVYLLSALDRGVVEDLSMVPVDHADEARRLLSRSGACLAVSHAELTRATVVEAKP
ncbi:lactate racemase domain-containing protein [Aquisphaera giovannonii]|nr:lactate racemase domain-containing protein [Aquisphaera giovannonii]